MSPPPQETGRQPNVSTKKGRTRAPSPQFFRPTGNEGEAQCFLPNRAVKRDGYLRTFFWRRYLASAKGASLRNATPKAKRKRVRNSHPFLLIIK